jgi:hypothetical protein
MHKLPFSANYSCSSLTQSLNTEKSTQLQVARHKSESLNPKKRNGVTFVTPFHYVLLFRKHALFLIKQTER